MADGQTVGPASALTTAQAALLDSGFRPAQFGRIVRLVRRILWPFMRPFHFYTLQRAEAAAEEVGDTRRHLEMLLHESRTMAQCALEQCAAVRDDQRSILLETQNVIIDMRRLVTMHSVLRSELTALTNRNVWLEDMANGATTDLANMLAQIDTLMNGEHAAGVRLSGLENRLSKREKHAPLFLDSVQGGIFILKNDELISEMTHESGVWDEHIITISERAARVVRARPGAPSALRAVDAGAHFGLLTVMLARQFDLVTSFEANDFNALMLTANVALNGFLDRVDIRRTALLATRTRVSLAPSEQQEIPLPLDTRGQLDLSAATNLGAYSFIQDGTGIYEVEAIPLDSLGMSDVGFIKIDVQGADGAVLVGAMQTIARCRPWLVFEWEEELSRAFGIPFLDVTTRLEQAGYLVRVLKRHNHKQVDYVAVPVEEVADLPPLPEDEALA